MRAIGLMEAVGYAGSLLAVCSFYTKTMIPLRVLALASSAAFVVYGFLGGSTPVLVLHIVLLPLNTLRLLQMRRLTRKARESAQGDPSMDWLVPLMARRTLASGAVLFNKGDEAQHLYVVLRGSIRLREVDVQLGPGTLIGEIGVFSPEGRRTATAVCETDVEIGSITAEKVVELYYQNPTFGFQLMQLTVRRLLANVDRRPA
jgi:CRP/FNR family cyclic AMP-dependent transcriptional regulator